ncbi:MAG: hypothetical protein JSV91_00775 [Phycisphaerales bacterium]|nr:MAG: hypothetical protein JSV91_00775 [Phycisphaerales bacterium]
MAGIHLARLTSMTLALSVLASTPAPGQVEGVIRELNNHDAVRGTEKNKAYKILFDAYLKLDAPPLEVGERFNQNEIHPKMANWSAVAGWAESNSEMKEAILECRDKLMIGLPYGADEVSAEYREAGLMVDIASGGNLRDNRFPYLDAVDMIAAYVAAETYRLLEAEQTEPAMDLAVAHIYVLRQFCDRQFLEEKMYNILMLIDALRNLRDQFYVYRDKITNEKLVDIAWNEMPFLRPDRNHLFMPEGDRVIAEALIRSVFDEATGTADEVKFAATFAEIQAEDEPLTRFGAARRWTLIARVHDSLDSSLDRLTLVYDDWWRRWRVQQYDPILDIPTKFEVTNEVRYAAVVYSMEDIEELFEIRNLLIAEVNGTAICAALCAYHQVFNAYPEDKVSTYGQFLRKHYSDFDPFNRVLPTDPTIPVFPYRQLNQRQAIDTPAGRIWVERDEFVLWALGQDHENNWAETHTADGSEGDVVIWPPIKAISREQGLLQ